ncbi:hypothetical protein LXL04_025705 [Taraxacum kok-saghyz]
MVFAVGDRVEFSGTLPGFTKTIYVGRVVSVGIGVIEVAHEAAFGPDGRPSIVTVDSRIVRPIPEYFRAPIHTGDIVDVWLSYCWWTGECVGEGEELCRVRFDFMPPDACRIDYKKMDIRKHQDCVPQDGSCHWRYCDR